MTSIIDSITYADHDIEKGRCVQCGKQFRIYYDIFRDKTYLIKVFTCVPGKYCKIEYLRKEYIHDGCVPEYEMANSKFMLGKDDENKDISKWIPREKRDDEVEFATREEWLEQLRYTLNIN